MTVIGEERRMPTTITREDARRETHDNYAVFVEEMLPDLVVVQFENGG